MLKDNIKILRKQKGLSQEELSVKLNVVRQTISKWEQGLSVPDAEMLISLSEVLDTSVSTLIGENIEEVKSDELKVISEKLEVINKQLYKEHEMKRKRLCNLLIIICVCVLIMFIFLLIMNSPYLNWDYKDPENAVFGVIYHSFEWLFIRLAPVILIASVVGIILIKKRK